MNYRKRRNQIGLSVYTVARELGVDYDKYLEVEKGKRPLEQEYIDKFQNIIENATQIKLERAMKMARIKPLFTNGEIKQKISDYGYTHSELGKMLGMSQGNVSNAFSNNPKLTSDDTIERIYDFLNNPFNKKVEKVIEEKTSMTRGKRRKSTPNVEKFFEEHTLEEIYTTMNYKREDFAKWLGVGDFHVRNVCAGRKNLSAKLKEKIYEAYQLYVNNKGEVNIENVKTQANNSNIEIKEPIETAKDNDDMFTLEELKNIIKENTMLKQKVAYYRKKINLYEKIMEKLV